MTTGSDGNLGKDMVGQSTHFKENVFLSIDFCAFLNNREIAAIAVPFAVDRGDDCSYIVEPGSPDAEL